MLPLRAAVVLPMVLAIGCAQGPDIEFGGETGSDTSPETRATPRLLVPSGETLRVDSTRIEPLSLQVSAIYPGLTVVLVDGRSLGPLTAPSPAGRLHPDRLELALSGGMVIGSHRLQLLTPGSRQALLSEVVEVQIEPSDPPRLTASLDPEPVLEDVHGLAVADGGRLLLAVVEEPSPPWLTAFATGDDGQWQDTPLLRAPIPGYRLEAGASSLAITAAPLDRETTLVAWRVGAPGRRIDASRISRDPSRMAIDGPDPVISLEPPLIESVEFASVGGPMLFGPTLVAELIAVHDVERPRPDEHGLVTVFFDPASGPSPARRVSLLDGGGLQGASPTLDLQGLRRGRQDTFTVRVDGTGSAVVHVQPSSGTLQLRPSAASPRQLPSAQSPVIAGLGAFGSRTMVSASEDGLDVVLLDDWGDGEPRHTVIEGPEAITWQPAVTVVHGSLVFLVPRGEAEVQAIQTSGRRIRPRDVQGLRCEAVATTASPHGNQAGRAPLACVRAGNLHLGMLEVTE